MRHTVFALGRDTFWLDATGRAGGKVPVQLIRCHGDYLRCLDHLPAPDPQALLLVDATGDPDIAATVRVLRRRGWRYVVAVAADPSWRQARAVLARSAGYDYWKKSYEPDVIRRDIATCLDDIRLETRENLVADDCA
jgi:hypothetical protein